MSKKLAEIVTFGIITLVKEIFGGLMKIYFTLKSIPELSSLPRDKRLYLWRKYYPKVFKHLSIRISLFVMSITMLIGFYFSLRIKPWVPYGYVVSGLICVICYLVFLQLFISLIRIYLKEELAKKGTEGEDKKNNNNTTEGRC